MAFYARYVPAKAPSRENATEHKSNNWPAESTQSEIEHTNAQAPHRENKKKDNPKKRKRHEEDKGSQGDHNETQDQANRHPTIMAKFQRSSRRSEMLKEQEAAGPSEEQTETQEESEELHG